MTPHFPTRLFSDLDVDTARVLVGRSQEADLCIAHKSVSREHCQIWRDGDEYRIRDLGATNTTRVNDAPVTEAVLADGDPVTVGERILDRTSTRMNYRH